MKRENKTFAGLVFLLVFLNFFSLGSFATGGGHRVEGGKDIEKNACLISENTCNRNPQIN